MNSQKCYDFPNSRENLVSRRKRRRVWMIMTPILLVLSVISIVVFLNLHSDPRPKLAISSLENFRLPRTVTPVSYKIHLIPRVDDKIRNFPVFGKIWIQIVCMQETTNITFHSKNITVDRKNASVTHMSVISEDIAILDHIIDSDKDFYTLTLANKLLPGEFYDLYLEFQYNLRDDLTGFYQSSYLDSATNTRIWLGTTQFEPTDARKAFPCWDEPDLKAEFKISLARQDNMSTISNMNIVSTEPVDTMPGWYWDHYDRSLPMPTYLVAFVVSDFTYRETTLSSAITGESILFRVWARRDAFHQTKYALEIGTKVLTFFENYFGVEYPLPKMDMIAVPDFENGAMENWGLIVFKENAMLYEPNGTSEVSKDTIATTISHELSHQWFGDLVTPSLWSYLWLNEGFATYLEYVGTDFAEPTWKKLDYFISEEIHFVFGQDVLESSHPISVNVNNPIEINEIFDGISYDKGASIIRMMNHFLTHKTFQKGLSQYLQKWKYNNTDPNKLWDALTEQAHLDRTLSPQMTVAEIMDSWTLQIGFPVVNVVRNYEQGIANFSQKKFKLVENINSSSDSRKWWIPISFATPAHNSDFTQTIPEFWISNSENSRQTAIPAAQDDWLLVNIHETGFYRVNYDLQNWNLIVNQLNINANAIATSGRAQIIDDALNLARASQLPYEIVLNLTTYLKLSENEYLPWKAFFDGMRYISLMIHNYPDVQSSFKVYIGSILSNQYKSIHFEEGNSETFMRILHRNNILLWACYSNNSDCVQKSTDYFSSWMKVPNPDEVNPLPLNIRLEIYCAVTRIGSEKQWKFLLERYLREGVASEKKQLLQGLACSKNGTLLEKLVNMSITSGSGILKQDADTVLKEIAKNPVGAPIVFRILNSRWTFVQAYVPFLGNVFLNIGAIFKSQEELLQLQAFKENNKGNLGSAERALDQAIEKVENNLSWMSKNFENVTNFLIPNNNSIVSF